MNWKINQINKVNVKNPILIEGLPGIGNVGKIAVDFIIDSLKAKKVFEITSYNFPHCVFVNEDNLVELPTIEIFHKKVGGKDFLFLAGDIQPLNERSCYEFCDNILDLFEQVKGKEIITLGGVALDRIPKQARVYCTGTNPKIIKRYQTNVVNNIYGVIGPIIGVSGLLTGLAKRRNLDAVTILAETFGHPTYLGVKSAKEILKVLNNKLGLHLNIELLDKEVSEIEKEIAEKTNKISKITKTKRDVSYIG